MIVTYACTKCDELTDVTEYAATRYEPADSTWGDGCTHCGAELEDEPVAMEPPEPDYEQMEDR